MDLEKTTSHLPIDSTWLAEADTVSATPSDSIVSTDTLVKKDTIAKKPQPLIPTVNVANTDTRAYLAAFYAALDSASSMPVRVVHYGDSQTEEDRITNVLRERWQKQYGGGGPGLLPLHQTVPTRTIRQWISINGVVQTAQGGPKRYIVYGPKSMRLTDSDEYGVIITPEEFLDMAFNWCVDGIDGKEYQTNPKYDASPYYHNYDIEQKWRDLGYEVEYYDFYSDGLRFSTSIEFS